MERSTPFPPERRISSRFSSGVRGLEETLELTEEDEKLEEEEDDGREKGTTKGSVPNTLLED